MQLFVLITIASVVSLVGGIYFKNISKVVLGSTVVTFFLYSVIYFIQGGTLSAWLWIAIFMQLVISFFVCFVVANAIFRFNKKKINL